MRLTNAYIIDGDVIKKMILESKKERDDSFSLKMFESAQRQQGMIDCLEVLLNEHLKPALPIVEESAIEFSKWLKHNDNGDTHYNPHTKETSSSIGFSPYDCFIDDIKTEKELFDLFKQDFLTKDF